MDCFKNNPYSILVVPLVWGVYEIRKFRFQLLDILTLAKEYKEIANNLNQKIEDLSSDKTDTFPVLRDIQCLTQKINRVFNFSEASVTDTSKED